MGDVFLNLLPLMLGAALVPVPLIILLLLLRGSNGLLRAAAFVGGMTIVRLVQGVLVLFVIDREAGAAGSSGPGPVVATLLTVLGILLWVTAVRTYLKDEDPDAPPPAWMGKLSGAAPALAFGLGAGLIAIAAKQWVFTLGALGVIAAADLGETSSIVAYLIFILGAQALLLLPLLATIVAPAPTAATLRRVEAWLDRHNRAIKIVVSVVFGTLFLWKGITGLIG